MFCSKCGKEIMDEAIVCPNCGCATNNYAAPKTVQEVTITNSYSNDYVAIKKFSEQARTLRNLSIFAAVFMFGIGIIFSIIIWIKAGSIKIPEVQTTNPVELAELETAKRHLKLANSLACLPIIGIGLGIMIGSLLPMFMM